MGCKPSRQSQVATGNMVCSGNLQSKQSNVSKEETEEADENGNLLENYVKVEEARLSDASDPEEGKLITVDSPNRYFSPSKDVENNLEGVIASFEYLSETKGSEIEEAEAVAMVEGEVVEMEKDIAPENDDRDEKEGEDDEGETSSKGSADVKETILAEEKESEATIAE